MSYSSEIIDANILLHSSMIEEYNNEPHFRPENKDKVFNVLKNIRQSINSANANLLDLGCGTGFILSLAVDLFDELHGVDVTPAMLNKVDLSSGKISLKQSAAEQLPYAENSFNVVTSYAFIHHVENYEPILKEAFRVLKKDGIFYVDLEPNQAFWAHMKQLEDKNITSLSDIVSKEVDAVLHTDDKVAEEFNIDPEVFRKAEYLKAYKGGIDAQEFINAALKIGFSECTVRYEWFLGQGNIMHTQSFENAAIIEAYLRRILPLSSGLFKYLRFDLKK